MKTCIGTKRLKGCGKLLELSVFNKTRETHDNLCRYCAANYKRSAAIANKTNADPEIDHYIRRAW